MAPPTFDASTTPPTVDQALAMVTATLERAHTILSRARIRLHTPRPRP